MMVSDEQCLPALVSTHEPLIIFSLPVHLRRGEKEKLWWGSGIQPGSAHTAEQIRSDMTGPRLKYIKLVSQSRFVKVSIPAG